jgi:hypothetical protein
VFKVGRFAAGICKGDVIPTASLLTTIEQMSAGQNPRFVPNKAKARSVSFQWRELVRKSCLDDDPVVPIGWLDCPRYLE